MKSLRWYENQLDNNDLSPELRAEYEAAADRLATQVSKDQANAKQREVLEKAERKAKGEYIAKLYHTAPDTLFAEYGHEFVHDYEINGCMVTSSVSPEHCDGEWLMNSPEEAKNKVKQLVNYRIYDHYFRD